MSHVAGEDSSSILLPTSISRISTTPTSMQRRTMLQEMFGYSITSPISQMELRTSSEVIKNLSSAGEGNWTHRRGRECASIHLHDIFGLHLIQIYA